MSSIPVVIFCGGRGTRLREETEVIPKPLVRVGEYPILYHIMKLYHAQGFEHFILLTGYKGEKIREYFYHHPIYRNDFTITFADGEKKIDFHSPKKDNWKITILDTGLSSETGARLKRAMPYLKNTRFMLTYGDGVSNVNLKELVTYHENHRATVTVTGVHPPGRFGEIEVSEGKAVNFWEKPHVRSGYINGGFFVVEPGIFSHLNDDSMLNFEKQVLPQIAGSSELAVYPHNGYWQCMDTLRDVEFLNEEWNSGRAGWKIWND